MTTTTKDSVSIINGILSLHFSNDNSMDFTTMPCSERLFVSAVVAGKSYNWTCHAWVMGTLINQVRTMRHNEKPDLSLLHIDQPEETIQDEEDEW